MRKLQIKREQIEAAVKKVENYIEENSTLYGNEEIGFVLFDDGRILFELFDSEEVNGEIMRSSYYLFEYELKKNTGNYLYLNQFLSMRAIKEVEKALIDISKGIVW